MADKPKSAGKRERRKMFRFDPTPQNTVLQGQSGKAIVKADGNIDYVCAGCEVVLLEAIRSDAQFIDVVFRCSACGTTSTTEFIP